MGGINPGRYLLTASSNGFTPIYGVPTPVAVVQAGIIHRNNVVKLYPEASISGIVMTADKAPVTGIEESALSVFYIRAKLVARRAATSITSKEGAYRLTKLSRGKYYIRAQLQVSGKNTQSAPLLQFSPECKSVCPR